MIWTDNNFQEYAAERFNEKYPKSLHYSPSEALAKNFIYRSCKILSRSELDTIENNPIFKELMKKYKQWLSIA